jgi:hypothetical protein
VVESTSLLTRQGFTALVGSNPTVSAEIFKEFSDYRNPSAPGNPKCRNSHDRIPEFEGRSARNIRSCPNRVTDLGMQESIPRLQQ